MAEFTTKGHLSLEEIKEIQEDLKKVNWRDPAERTAIAETITRELREDLMQDNLLAALQVDVQTFEPGQTMQFVTTKGTKAYVHAPGSDAPRSQLVNKTVNLYAELVSVMPEIELAQLQTGRYGGLVELRRQAEFEFTGTRYSTIWTTLVGSIASTAANYWAVADTAAANVKVNALQSGFDYVADQPGSDIIAIVGRRGGLGFLSTHGGYGTNGPSETLKSEIDSSKFIEHFRGVPVVLLNQYQDVYGVNMIDENEIILLGRDTVKMGIDRPLETFEDLNPNNLMWALHMVESYGVAVVNGTRNARIKIT